MNISIYYNQIVDNPETYFKKVSSEKLGDFDSGLLARRKEQSARNESRLLLKVTKQNLKSKIEDLQLERQLNKLISEVY